MPDAIAHVNAHASAHANGADVVPVAAPQPLAPTRPDASGGTDALGQLALLGDLIQAIGAAFDLSADDLAARETFDGLDVSAIVSLQRIAQLDAATAQRWFDTLGVDLSISLALEGLDPSFDPVAAELRADEQPAATFVDLQRATLDVYETQGDTVSCNVRMTIGKRQAREQAEQALADRRAMSGGTLAPEAALVFYYTAACERLLTLRALSDWNARGLGGDERRMCVFLCDSEGYLAGPALEVIGASAPTPVDALPVSRAAWRRFAERAAAEQRLRAAESAWSVSLAPPTAEHLRLVQRAPGLLERLAARIEGLRAQIAACALASSGERVAGASGPDDLLLRFAGARPATVHLTSGAAPTDLDAHTRDALVALANWSYRDASPDKLAIARQALADALTAGATLTLEQLCAVAPTALDIARANFAIYLRGATERYFQLRSAAQQTVSGFAEATRKAVTDLTSDVVDNLFRTVGLIVGVLVAWLIQPSASYTLAHIAAALYTGYIIFVIAYLLRARQERYHLERKALDDTLAAMTELAPSERERLRQPARDAAIHFERYYRLTRGIYITLAAVGAVLVLLMFLPGAHTLLAASTQHASSATPTPKR